MRRTFLTHSLYLQIEVKCYDYGCSTQRNSKKKRDTPQNFRANVDVYFGLMTKILNFRVIPLYENTAYVTKLANVVISAVGKRNFISHIDLFNTDICIDVGINYDENGKQHGDCADEVYKMNNIKVTPRIGGVGLMTRAMLLYNVCVVRYGEEKMEKVIE